MTRKWIITALAVAGIAPVALGAQETPRPRSAPRAFAYTLTGNRARIGVLVNRQANAETDKVGAKIDAVTPGGPADKAGLKAGDIITKVNGTSLAGASAEDDEDSGPGRKLVELVGALDPGDTVKVEYRRGTETRTATLVTDEQGFKLRGTSPLMGEFEMPKMTMPFVTTPEGRGFSYMCFGDAWCDLDLVTLNSDLGDYFGTKEGVLVIKAPSDSALPLKSGDVILSIGGRKPTTPAHAMRILRSYDAGEAVSIEIMRHQRRQTLSWTVPEAGVTRRVRPSARPRGEQSYWRAPEAARELARAAVERNLQSVLRAQDAARERALRSMLRARFAQRLRNTAI
ncbi:MAG TPA: PDZ domain-containing protein [Gemmatimonadales bacterium]|nr:PDZ domain-containing protein [Gemmatimonadales bacterium]